MDNKLWEGHRVIYPELRDLVMEENRLKASRPNPSEEYLSEMESILFNAAESQQQVLIKYYHAEAIKELVTSDFKVLKGKITCIAVNGKILSIGCRNLISVNII